MRELLRDGKAYLCFATKEELADITARQQATKLPTGYYGRWAIWRDKTAEDVQAALDEGRPYVVRFRSPGKAGERTSFVDAIRGQLEHEANRNDVVILKASDTSPRLPTYHFAHAVDDHLMRVNLVIRGEEWISSTPKHLLLYRWLGLDEPAFAHMPLLRNTDKSKISKRKNPAARLTWFQEQGYLPEALRNFLGLLGYSLPSQEEVFTFEEMSRTFDWSRVNTVGPVFDLEKLAWLNGHYVRELSPEEFLRRSLPFLVEAGLVTERTAGTRRIYRLNPTAVAALRDQLDTYWTRALAAYGDIAEEAREQEDPTQAKEPS